MKIFINDTSFDLHDSAKTLGQAIVHSGMSDRKGLAVAVNDTIVPHTAWDTFPLKENDVVTIIRATQGG